MQKILVVDDQDGIRILLCEVLRQEGYEVYDASNGEEAIALIESVRPDLVLLDMKIPRMNGLEILKWIKNVTPLTCVIIMTAYAELNLIQEALDLGAVTYFLKPFDINVIRKVVKEQLNSSEDQ